MALNQALQALRLKVHSLYKIGFIRSTGVLVGGTAVAQLITVLVLPIAARLYTPADFSVLAVYAAIVGIASVVACLRLEIAIPIPEDDDDAANLLLLALYSCTAVSVVAALFIWIFSVQMIERLGQPGLQPFLWMLPIGIWVTSAYAAVQLWATRKKRFISIAKTRIAQALGGAVAQLSFGLFPILGPFGLILGQAISGAAGLFGLGSAARTQDHSVLQRANYLSMRRVLISYNRFPKYSTIEAFLNTAGHQLPVLIIAAYAIGPDAGYLLLAIRAMSIPMSLIGGAISQVYLASAAEELRVGRISEFTKKILEGLVKAGIGPLIFIGAVAPGVFPMVFGQDWQRAGDMVTWMTPWFIMQFLASPISMVLHVTSNQRVALILQAFGFLLRVGLVSAAVWLAHDYMIEAYVFSGAIFYLTYLIVASKFAGIGVRTVAIIGKRSFSVIFLWILTSAAALTIINFVRAN